MRGRLIFPFIVEIAQLDTDATDADPDGAGPLDSGYDDIFREPVRVPDGSQIAPQRRVEVLTRVRCQIEPEQVNQLQMFAGGDTRGWQMFLVFHFRDLENAGMVDVNGEATIRVNDRLHAIYECTPEMALVQTIRNPPGLYATQVQPRGFGFSRKRNLLLVEFRDREQAVRR